MNICSAVCLSGVHTCCNEKGSQEKSCCQSNDSEKKENKSCDNTHLKYFSSMGQFSETKEIVNSTYFPTILSTVSLASNDDIYAINHHYLQYQYSHSPPSKTDIRIAIQSFQI